MTQRSMLAKQEIDKLLAVAKRCAERGYAVGQILFLHVVDGRFLHMLLDFQGDAEAKAAQFLVLGRQLHEQGLMPLEAVMLSESWFVDAQKAPAALQLAPSQHPARQEAIVLIGRSADNRRYTQVVQPFTRDKSNKPVWQPLCLAAYDESRDALDGPTGILDFLFEGVAATV